MNRRRSASLVAIIVAGLASIGTSPPPPTPPPSVDESVSGSVHLTHEAPSALRVLRVRVDGVGQGLPSPKVAFSPSALITRSAGGGDVRLSIVAAEQDPDALLHAYRTGPAEQAAPVIWPLQCDPTGCEGRFGLVVDWLDPAPDETGDVDWTVKAHVELWGAAANAVKPEVLLTTTEVDAGVDAKVTSASVSADPVRLDVDDRLAMWRLSFRLGNEPLQNGATWPLVVLARLVPTTEVIQAPKQGGEPGPIPFVEASDPGWGGGMRATSVMDPIEFNPFWKCEPGEQCLASYVVGLTMPYIDPDAAFDAGWTLDVRAIGGDGEEVPVEVSARPVPSMHMIRATTKGTTVLRAANSTPDFRYTLREDPAPRPDRTWDGLPLSTYGILRTRATWTGSSPIPPNFSVTFGPPYSSLSLGFDKEEELAFTPGAEGGRCRVGQCDLSGYLRSSIGYSGSLPSDWGVSIEWEFEAGIGTTAGDGESKLIIEEVPQPS